MEMHKFYESHYELITELIDEVAERVTQLGERANGTMKEFLKTTRLEEGSSSPTGTASQTIASWSGEYM